MERITRKIFEIRSEQDFNELAIEIFQFQAVQNKVYSKYLSLLNIDFHAINHYRDIPFLPVEFFKTHKIISGTQPPVTVFESSGTTSENCSTHHILSETLYKTSFTEGFRYFYGNPSEYCLLALLPSYLERQNSSLVYMMNHLIKMSKKPDSGFYLDNLSKLNEVVNRKAKDHIPTILIGVSFALLDLAEKFPDQLPDHITIMETGGMKGRRKEITRQELHQKLKKAFGCKNIHSEYGMTELLSQAYSSGDGIFKTPPWMKILVRDLYDPFEILPAGISGGINVIDLANVYSCSFISTSDTGRLLDNQSFEISGRFDQAEIRGCNLMVL